MYRLFLVFIFAQIVACTTPPKATVPTQPETLDSMQLFEQKLESMRKTLSIPGMSVAVLKEQEIVFNKGFGYADIESQIPATENTPYNIASLTKPFGATILMSLVEEGRLNLNDAMADILRESYFQYGDHNAHGYADLCKKLRKLAWRYGALLWDYRCHTEKILVRHHLTHTSQGMPGVRYKYNGFLFTLKIPEKELTMILLANSDGASRGFDLGKGNVLNSPFALLFINQLAGMKATHQ